MLVGLVVLVVSVRLSTPSLALFLTGGALIGAGSGAVFKGTTGIVLEASPPESRVAMTSALLIALYVGLSVPVIGAGVALSLGASAPNTVLVFAILVGLGVAAAGWRCWYAGLEARPCCRRRGVASASAAAALFAILALLWRRALGTAMCSHAAYTQASRHCPWLR